MWRRTSQDHPDHSIVRLTTPSCCYHSVIPWCGMLIHVCRLVHRACILWHYNTCIKHAVRRYVSWWHRKLWWFLWWRVFFSLFQVRWSVFQHFKMQSACKADADRCKHWTRWCTHHAKLTLQTCIRDMRQKYPIGTCYRMTIIKETLENWLWIIPSSRTTVRLEL